MCVLGDVGQCLTHHEVGRCFDCRLEPANLPTFDDDGERSTFNQGADRGNQSSSGQDRWVNPGGEVP